MCAHTSVLCLMTEELVRCTILVIPVRTLMLNRALEDWVRKQRNQREKTHIANGLAPRHQG